jgi:hypothetical protein
MSLIQEKLKLVSRIANGSLPPLDPTSLPLNEIEAIEEVFQHRSGNLGTSQKHLSELLKALKNSNGEPFEPLLVFWIGDAWALIDGHHRYTAYREARYGSNVPVEVFKGTLDEAIGQALRGNVRDKLVMSSPEKSNGAWRLVVGTKLSLSKTTDASGRTRPTIVAMRKVRDNLLRKRPDLDLGDLSWADAVRVNKGLELATREFDEEWEEKEARALAERLTRHFDIKRLGGQPGIFWRAIEIWDSRLTAAFLDSYGIDPETLDPLSPESTEEICDDF